MDVKDLLLNLLDLLYSFSGLNGIEDVTKTVAEYSTSAYQFSHTMANTVVKPVAAVIVAIILVLELARIGQKFDGDHRMGVQQVASAMIKGGLVVVAIQNTDLIISAINEVGDVLISGAGNVSVGADGTGVPDTVREQVETAGIMSQLASFVFLFIPALLAALASVLVKIVVMLRFAEIYLLSAFAPLPLAFLGHPETKSITVSYLRKYGAAVLHGAMIVVSVKMYSFFMAGVEPEFTPDDPGMLGSFILGPILFVAVVFASGRFAKAVVGE